MTRIEAKEPPNPNRSPICVRVVDEREDRERKGVPFGIAAHTTGKSLVKRAEQQGVTPIKRAVDYYKAAKYSAHYVIGYDGTRYQISLDDRRVPHIGVSKAERTKYLNGRWVRDFSKPAVARWRERWPGYKSPQHLFPGTSPNSAYIGCEMVPLAKARRNGLWFTDEQHQSFAELAVDCANRHGWPDGWQHTGRLVGHEDVDAYGRWNKAGGWDPGALRVSPRFSWDIVQGLIG